MTIQPKKLNCSKLAALATMCSFAAVLSAGASASAVPKTATIIPAPREIRATGGEYWEKKTPKLEKVAGLPPEGYELSITTNGITIRHSDDAGAYYAKMTLFHTGRYDAKAKCKVYPCLEIRDWPQFRWRGVHLDDSRRFFGKEAILQLLKQMSWFKFNVFHWHLTDDQLWSLEIPGYPELQKYGAEWYIKGPAKWRGRTWLADSAAIGPRTPSVSTAWNGKCGRADSRSRRCFGRIPIPPSVTSRSLRSVRRIIVAASSVPTSTAPR